MWYNLLTHLYVFYHQEMATDVYGSLLLSASS